MDQNGLAISRSIFTRVSCASASTCGAGSSSATISRTIGSIAARGIGMLISVALMTFLPRRPDVTLRLISDCARPRSPRTPAPQQPRALLAEGVRPVASLPSGEIRAVTAVRLEGSQHRSLGIPEPVNLPAFGPLHFELDVTRWRRATMRAPQSSERNPVRQLEQLIHFSLVIAEDVNRDRLQPFTQHRA